MKSLNIIAALAFGTLLPAVAQAKTFPFLTCGQVGGTRRLSVAFAQDGVEAKLSGRRAAIAGSIDNRVVTLKVGDWQDADFLSLELKEVNGRYIGVLIEPATSGPAAFKETVFSCAEIVPGSASSNGG